MLIYIDKNLKDFLPFFQDYGKILLFSPEKDSLKKFDLQKPSAFIISSKTLFFTNAIKPSSTNIQFIGTATSGIDHISKTWQNSPQLIFKSAIGANSTAVSNYATSALQYLIDRKKMIPKQETLGIIGFGNIGKKVFDSSQRFNFKNTFVYDPLLNQSTPPLCNLETFQKEASILTLHCSLAKNNPYPSYQFMNQKWIDNMQHPFHLINSARGSLITEEILLKALQENKIKSLILDVFPKEPLLSQELFSYCDIVTPHIAGYSLNSKLNAAKILLKYFCTYFNLDYINRTSNIKNGVVKSNKMYAIEDDYLNFKEQYKKHYEPSTLTELRENYTLRKEFL